jgi:hypothetical protein
LSRIAPVSRRVVSGTRDALRHGADGRAELLRSNLSSD